MKPILAQKIENYQQRLITYESPDFIIKHGLHPNTLKTIGVLLIYLIYYRKKFYMQVEPGWDLDFRLFLIWWCMSKNLKNFNVLEKITTTLHKNNLKIILPVNLFLEFYKKFYISFKNKKNKKKGTVNFVVLGRIPHFFNLLNRLKRKNFTETVLFMVYRSLPATGKTEFTFEAFAKRKPKRFMYSINKIPVNFVRTKRSPLYVFKNLKMDFIYDPSKSSRNKKEHKTTNDVFYK